MPRAGVSRIFTGERGITLPRPKLNTLQIPRRELSALKLSLSAPTWQRQQTGWRVALAVSFRAVKRYSLASGATK